MLGQGRFSGECATKGGKKGTGKGGKKGTGKGQKRKGPTSQGKGGAGAPAWTGKDQKMPKFRFQGTSNMCGGRGQSASRIARRS